MTQRMKVLSVILVASLMTGAAWLLPGHMLNAMPNGQSTEQVASPAAEFSDCEIKVSGTYEGVDYDVTITISDMTGFECIRLKVALLAALL